MSKDFRKDLYARLGAVEAELDATEEMQKRIVSAAESHHDRAAQRAERTRARLHHDEFDSEGATEYHDALKERHAAGLVAAHLRRD